MGLAAAHRIATNIIAQNPWRAVHVRCQRRGLQISHLGKSAESEVARLCKRVDGATHTATTNPASWRGSQGSTAARWLVKVKVASRVLAS